VIAQSRVLGADDNSDAPVDAPEVAKLEPRTGCARPASTSLFEGSMRESISGVGATAAGNFLGRAWSGRPPERCRNQHGHPVAIIHRSLRSTAVLATVTRRAFAEKDAILFQDELIDTINRGGSPPRRGASRCIPYMISPVAYDCRDITRSRCS